MGFRTGEAEARRRCFGQGDSCRRRGLWSSGAVATTFARSRRLARGGGPRSGATLRGEMLGWRRWQLAERRTSAALSQSLRRRATSELIAAPSARGTSGGRSAAADQRRSCLANRRSRRWSRVLGGGVLSGRTLSGKTARRWASGGRAPATLRAPVETWAPGCTALWFLLLVQPPNHRCCRRARRDVGRRAHTFKDQRAGRRRADTLGPR